MSWDILLQMTSLQGKTEIYLSDASNPVNPIPAQEMAVGSKAGWDLATSSDDICEELRRILSHGTLHCVHQGSFCVYMGAVISKSIGG
jgi:hypothetical protein